MKKNTSLQVELWTACNNLCTFCYLGNHNRHTPDNIKNRVLIETLKMISNEEIYTSYDTLAYIGGELFQGQLSNPEVKTNFFELMKKTSSLLKRNVIKSCWISATLTHENQQDLYDTLDIFFDGIEYDTNSSEGFWLITSYDTIGRFHSSKHLENWKYNMKNIKSKYPTIKFNTCTILTGDIVDKYLNNEFSFTEFMTEFNTNFFFKQPAPGSLGDNLTLSEAKHAMQRLLPNFFPNRNKFIQFLNKFALENYLLYDKLYNVKYRADDLYRNYKHDELMLINHRVKDSIKETTVDREAAQNSCGHLLNYAAYIDSDKCMICDKNMMVY